MSKFDIGTSNVKIKKLQPNYDSINDSTCESDDIDEFLKSVDPTYDPSDYNISNNLIDDDERDKFGEEIIKKIQPAKDTRLTIKELLRNRKSNITINDIVSEPNNKTRNDKLNKSIILNIREQINMLNNNIFDTDAHSNFIKSKVIERIVEVNNIFGIVDYNNWAKVQIDIFDNIIINFYNRRCDEAREFKYELNITLFDCIGKVNTLLNEFVFKEYLFGKDIHVTSCLYDLINPKKYRKKIDAILLEPKHQSLIIKQLDELKQSCLGLYDIYDKYRYKYKYCRKIYFDNLQILKSKCSHPLAYAKSSQWEELAMKALDDLCNNNNYKLFYFYGHRFYFCRHVGTSFEFDFLCFVIRDNRLVIFVIEIDGLQHKYGVGTICGTKNTMMQQHIRDILKQYYLSQMNIHLLRINDFNNITEQIFEFIDDIFESLKYKIKNRTIPVEHLFQNNYEHYGLTVFCKYFKTQHSRVILGRNCRDDLEYVSGNGLIQINDADNKSYLVTDDDFQKFMDDYDNFWN